MPAFDAEKGGWTSMFTKGYKVYWPEELTEKWWSKHKQLAAKIKGHSDGGTGMGEALEELEKLFNKITWPEFTGHATSIGIEVERIKNFIASKPPKDVHEKLKEVREIAEEQAPELKKSMLTKKTGQALDTIAEVAEQLELYMNSKTMTSTLKEMLEVLAKEALVKNAKLGGEALKTLPLTLKELPERKVDHQKYLKAFQNDPDGLSDEKDVTNRAKLGSTLSKSCRKCTTILGNLLKASKGVCPYDHFNVQEGQKLYDVVAKIAMDQSNVFMEKMDPDKAERLVKLVDSWCDQFIELTEQIELKVLDVN